MLRRVISLAALCVALSAPALAGELITYPTPPSGSLAYAPAPFATIDMDWLGAFAKSEAAAPRFIDMELSGFLSGTLIGGGTPATIDLAGLTWNSDPPATGQQNNRLAPLDF